MFTERGRKKLPFPLKLSIVQLLLMAPHYINILQEKEKETWRRRRS